MDDCLAVGDRVVTRHRRGINDAVMVVTEISPPGYAPASPSTYTVRCGPPGGTEPEEWVFGEATLRRLGW